MSVIAAALVTSAVVGAVSADRAADTSADALNSSTDKQIAADKAAEARATKALAPWVQYGQDAMGQEFEKSPGYDFARQEGTRGIENSFSARGSGGNALRALTEFSTGLAQQDYNNWKGQNQYDIAMGGNAAAGQANASMQSGMAQSQAYGQQGTNLANNAWNRYSGINNAVQSGLGNYLYGKESGLIGNNVNNDWLQEVPYTPYRRNT